MSTDLFAPLAAPPPPPPADIPTMVERLGRALYGSGRWQTEMAEDLGISARTVRRWVAGDCIPSSETVVCIHRLIRTRRAQVDSAESMLTNLLKRLDQ